MRIGDDNGIRRRVRGVRGYRLDMRMGMRRRSVSGQHGVEFANEIQLGPTRKRQNFIKFQDNNLPLAQEFRNRFNAIG
jgi:hypothetical protein